MNPSSWDKKEWIKDVLSKSGTDIVEIKDEKTKEIRKMVYYSSLPLITKSDQQHHQQLCSPLNGETQIYHLPSSQQTAQLHLMQQVTSHSGHNNINGTNNNNSTTLLIPSSNNQSYIKLETRQSSTSSSSTTSLNHQQQNVQLDSSSSNNSNGNSNNTSKISNNNNRPPPIKPQFKCDQCNMIFGSKSAQTSHIKSHKTNKDNNYSTTAAQQQLSSNKNGINQQTIMLPNTIAQSIGNGTSSDPYQCNVCQKTFAVPARLIRHYRTHTGERPFECEFCHKMFSVKENLQVHRRIHTKERPYKCDVCGRAFEHSGKLHRHMRIHTGERPHKCSVCSKTFIQSGQLVIHMRTHTGEKPYKCPVEGCGKGFTCSKQLKVHSRTHTGEKPYHCDICFRDFGYNHVLKLHKVQHYGSKCYKCTICDETFKSKKEMEAHIKGHANELPDDDDDDEQRERNSQQMQQQHSPVPQQQHQNQIGNNQQNIKKETSHRFTNGHQDHRTESKLITETEKSRDSITTTISNNSSPPPPSLSHQQHHHHINNNNNINHHNNQSLSSSSIMTYDNNTDDDNNVPIDDIDMEQKIEYIPSNETITLSSNDDNNIDDGREESGNNNNSHNNNLYNRVYQRYEQQSAFIPNSHPTINPALLAAASIASRRVEEANNMRMGMTSPPPTSISNESTENSNETHHELSEYYKMERSKISVDQQSEEDMEHINQPIDCYTPRYDTLINQQTSYFAPAPVAEFKPSLRHKEIVRKVEAAIAGAGYSPPRSTSTESPERSSSPESDTIMMANRDVMTLPLRKRKLYLNDNQSSKDVTPVVRISSVIQFAKAS